MIKELQALSERLLQLASDEGTAQIHDVAVEIARAVERINFEWTERVRLVMIRSETDGYNKGVSDMAKGCPVCREAALPVNRASHR